MKTLLARLVILVLAFVNPTFAQYPEWKHAGSLCIITTPEGADLAPASLIENFPLLVRLEKNGNLLEISLANWYSTNDAECYGFRSRPLRSLI